MDSKIPPSFKSRHLTSKYMGFLKVKRSSIMTSIPSVAFCNYTQCPPNTYHHSMPNA